MLAFYQNNEFSTPTLRPFHSTDGRYTCLFEGALVNERLLQTKLERTGVYVQSSRLEEVLLELYRFSGDHFVEILRGKFAFIIFDHEKSELIVARDRYGTKSLYYQVVENGIAFASQIADLKTNQISAADLNKKTLRHYFSCGYFPETETYIKAIHHLPAGCLVKYNAIDGMRVEPFTDMLVIEGAKQTVIEDEQFRQIIIEGIQTRISHQQMHGLIYTGKTIEQIMMTTAKLAGCDIKLFMAEFDSKQAVDATLEPHLIRRLISPADYLESARCATHLTGLPFADPWMPVDFLLTELASKHVDVMLDAAGADLLFGTEQSLFDWLKSFRKPLIFSEKEKAMMLSFEGATWHDLIADDWAEITDLDRVSKWQTIALNMRLRGSDTLKVEKMMAAYELEASYPFIDDRVLNVAKFLTGNEKRFAFLLKQVFNNQISNFGLTTKTRPHQVPLSKWLRTALYEPVKELFEQRVAATYFNQETLLRMLERHRLRLGNFSERIWAVAIFIIWLEEITK